MEAGHESQHSVGLHGVWAHWCGEVLEHYWAHPWSKTHGQSHQHESSRARLHPQHLTIGCGLWMNFLGTPWSQGEARGSELSLLGSPLVLKIWDVPGLRLSSSEPGTAHWGKTGSSSGLRLPSKAETETITGSDITKNLLKTPERDNMQEMILKQWCTLGSIRSLQENLIRPVKNQVSETGPQFLLQEMSNRGLYLNGCFHETQWASGKLRDTTPTTAEKLNRHWNLW